MRLDPIAVARTPFWAYDLTAATRLLVSDPHRGLASEVAAERLRLFGPNILERSTRVSPLILFARQFTNPLILILVVAGAVTLFTAHIRDALFIFASVIINAALGFYQENKAEQALAELKTYLKQRTRVIRDEYEQEIDAEHLVPGDLIRLAQGDRVPADAILIFANDLQIDESVLTGESLPVTKTVGPSVRDAALGDRSGMVHAGTLVTQGVATALVARTGFMTELGSIALMVANTAPEPTPLQTAIKRFSLKTSVILVVLTAAVFAVGLSSGYPLSDMFLTAVAIAVSAIPEGLPVALTVILAIGVQRMARRKGVIRKLLAAEALGSTTVILTDKTGTLTMAALQLHTVIPYGSVEERDLVVRAIGNADVLIENPLDPPHEWRINGRMVETALVRGAAMRGIDVVGLKRDARPVHLLPFNAANKFSVSLSRVQNGPYIRTFVGAPDVLLQHTALDPERKRAALADIEARAATGELVLGIATKEMPSATDPDMPLDEGVTDLVWHGLLGFRDPVRPGVGAAMQALERSGIKTVILTGDHQGTALAIAREVGFDVPQGSAVNARDLAALSPLELRTRLSNVRLIARVAPLDKMRIVRAFQELGETVAMTGDGVNDAPSIKQADVGIAMGSGTEVARSVADLVLLDDNYTTIAHAVEEGRRIVNNIRKVIVYLFSSVLNELVLIGGALVFGLPLPLSALQILWINFFSDSFPAIAFAFEQDIDGLSHRPRRLSRGLLEPPTVRLLAFVTGTTSAALFALYWFLMGRGFDQTLVHTFIFMCFGAYSLLLAFPVRSFEKSIGSYPLFSNQYLVGGAAIGITLMFAAVYLPPLQKLLGTVALPLPWLGAVFGVGIALGAVVELGKWFFHIRPSST